MSRIGRVTRETKETKLLVEVNLDGPASVQVETGVPFTQQASSPLYEVTGLFSRTITSTQVHWPEAKVSDASWMKSLPQ